MKYQKIKHVLGNTPNHPSKFRTRNWIEIKHNASGGYSNSTQIKFKTTKLKLGFFDYSACERLNNSC